MQLDNKKHKEWEWRNQKSKQSTVSISMMSFYIRALSENESLAEEITQETFLKAMNNIEKFDGRKDIRAWLFVIAKNTYFRYCRRNKIYVGEEFSEIMQDSMQDTSPAVLDQIVQDETVRNLKRYAELIPEPYRRYFTCGYTVSSPLSRSENAIRKVQDGQE